MNITSILTPFTSKPPLPDLKTDTPIEWKWLYVKPELEKTQITLDISSLTLVSLEGGYGVVYKTPDDKIVKLIKQNGKSENAMIFREAKRVEIPDIDIDDNSDFIVDIQNEVDYQMRAHQNIRANDDEPIAPVVYFGGVFVLLGHYYGIILMENVKGTPLSYKYMEILPVKDLVEIHTQISEFLRLIHELNIAHNDLHTTNIIIQRKNDKPVIKVIDWGLGSPIDVSPFWLSKERRASLPLNRQIDEVGYRFLSEISALINARRPESNCIIN
jgi:serine/threonine protein kinase